MLQLAAQHAELHLKIVLLFGTLRERDDFVGSRQLRLRAGVIEFLFRPGKRLLLGNELKLGPLPRADASAPRCVCRERGGKPGD